MSWGSENRGTSSIRVSVIKGSISLGLPAITVNMEKYQLALLQFVYSLCPEYGKVTSQ